MNLERMAEAASPVGTSVLVVEDDIEIRHLLATRLRESGFTVREASDASEALRLMDTAIHIDALITDVEMPGHINGISLAEQARARRPDLRVIVVSGTNAAEEVRRRGMAFFLKPYDLSSLITSIREDATQ